MAPVVLPSLDVSREALRQARLLNNQHDYAAALAILDGLHHPRLDHSWSSLLVRVCSKLGLNDRYLAILEANIEKHPVWSWRKCHYFKRLHNFGKAKEAIEIGLVHFPSDYTLLHQKVMLLVRGHDLDEAIRVNQFAIDNARASLKPFALSQMARLYELRGNKDMAKVYIHMALELKPNRLWENYARELDG